MKLTGTAWRQAVREGVSSTCHATRPHLLPHHLLQLPVPHRPASRRCHRAVPGLGLHGDSEALCHCGRKHPRALAPVQSRRVGDFLSLEAPLTNGPMGTGAHA